MPVYHDQAQQEKSGEEVDFKTRMDMMPLLMGQAAGAVNDIKPAAEIMEERAWARQRPGVRARWFGCPL